MTAPRIGILLDARLGEWSRQLRPRLAGRPIEWLESRSEADLEIALERPELRIALFDRKGSDVESLQALALARQLRPDVLSLAILDVEHADLAPTAREIGATAVFVGRVPPPRVAALLDRWIEVVCEREGWADKLQTPAQRRV